MPTIIDALVVTLGLDTTDYKKGQQEAEKALDETKEKANDTAKDMEESGKRAASFFSSIKNQIIALAGVTVSIGGLQQFITSFTGKLNELSTASTAFGMSARALDGWTKAGAAFGVTAQEIASSFSKISDSQGLFKSGGPFNQTLIDLTRFSQFTSAGIDVINDTPEQIERKFAENFHKLNPSQQRTYGASLGWGYSGQQWLASDNPLAGIDRATARSGVNDDATNAAKKFREQWNDLDQSLSKIGITIYKSLIPYVDQFDQWLNNLSKWMEDHPKEINDAIKTIFDGITSMATAANDAAHSLSGLTKILDDIKDFLNNPWGMDLAKKLGDETGASNIGKKFTWDWLKQQFAYPGDNVGPPLLDQLQGIRESFQIPALTDGVDQYGNPIQAPQATGKGAALLEWMGTQFSQLEANFNLPDGLLKSVATTESGGNQFAVSGAGAKGLFQFMPGTAKDLGLNGNDVFDPQKSAEAAARYLSQLLKSTHGNLQEAVAAYNWGIGNVQKKGLEKAPLETQNYVPKVLAGIQVGPAAAAQRHINNVTNNSTSKADTYHIGRIDVKTDASNVNGIVTDAGRKIANSNLAAPYVTGVSG